MWVSRLKFGSWLHIYVNILINNGELLPFLLITSLRWNKLCFRDYNSTCLCVCFWLTTFKNFSKFYLGCMSWYTTGTFGSWLRIYVDILINNGELLPFLLITSLHWNKLCFRDYNSTCLCVCFWLTTFKHFSKFYLGCMSSLYHRYVLHFKHSLRGINLGTVSKSTSVCLSTYLWPRMKE